MPRGKVYGSRAEQQAAYRDRKRLEELEKIEEQSGVVRVEAPAGKCWSGAIGDSTKEGCGSKSFEIENEAIIGGNAQKMTPRRWTLTLVLEVDGKRVDESTTDAEFGIAQVIE